MSEEIRQGRSTVYEESEMDRLRQQSNLVSTVSSRAVWGAVFRFFLPAIIFLALLYLVLVWLKAN